MNYKISDGFRKFKKLRDSRLEGLERCNIIFTQDELLEKGFKLINSESFEEDGENHEFHEYLKGEYRVVYLESYIEREGGMYVQSFYASPNCQKTNGL